MKNMKQYIPFLLMALLLSCAKQEIPADTQEEGEAVCLGVSIAPQTGKTELGQFAEGKYPTLWQTGDQISVNGKTSAALTEDQAGKSTALFSFRGKITAPFNFLYPATISEDVVTFPDTQEYCAGTFDPASTPMWASVSEFTDAQLNHLSSLLRFDVKGGCTLKEISLSAVGSEPLSGSFKMVKDGNGAFTGEMQAQETAPALTFSFGDGLVLDESNPLPVYIAIPYGTYSKGIRAILTSSEDEVMMLTFFSEGKEVKPSKVLHFEEVVNFVPGADGADYIYTEEDLANLEYSVNSKAYIMDDITLTDGWQAIPAFAGVIDGLDHTLTASGALFNQTSDGGEMTIKNLNLTSASGAVGPFINVSAGEIALESCSLSDMTDIPVKMTGGSLRISDCSFVGNCTGVNKASAVSMTGGNMDVSGTVFKNNGSTSANSSSVISLGNPCKGSLVTLRDCVFDSNKSKGASNGVMVMVAQFAGTLYMTNCVVAGNVNNRYGIIHQSANTTATGDTESFIGINNCLFYDNYGTASNADGCNISIAGRHLIMNSTFVNTADHKSIMNLRCGALGTASISVGGDKSSIIVNNIFKNDFANTNCFDAGAANKYYQTLIGYNRYSKGFNSSFGGVKFDAADLNKDTAGTYNPDGYLWTWTPSEDDKAAMLSSDIETYVAGKTDASFSDYVTSYFTWLKSQEFGSRNALEVDLYGNVRDKSEYWPGCYQANQ